MSHSPESGFITKTLNILWRLCAIINEIYYVIRIMQSGKAVCNHFMFSFHLSFSRPAALCAFGLVPLSQKKRPISFRDEPGVLL